MADDINDLVDDIEQSIISTASAYARVEMRVFPVHAITKEPMPGYGWPQLATTKINEVVEDFDRAIQLWGEGNVSVGWALGLDGYVAIDIDAADPPWLPQIESGAGINITRRGRHLIFQNPEGLTPGNGVSGFPTQGWGEVRGAGGYIIIAGPDRPGLNPMAIKRCRRFPRPEWLTAYGGYTNAATKAEVIEFARTYAATKGAQYLNWLPKAISEQWHPENEGHAQFGRHPLACEWMAKVADEAALGLYSFKDGLTIVRGWWHTVTPPERWTREWDGIVTWAVGRALAKVENPPTDEDAGDEPVTLLGDDITSSPYVDWSAFWTDDVGEHEWLIEGFWPAGRAVLLHAPAKTGKSLWALYLAVELALGIRLDSGEQFRPLDGEQFRVLYVDYEMTEADLRERLMEFGIGPQHDLSGLYYTLLTSEFGSLDTPGGASLFLAEIDAIKPHVVVLDTFGRAVDGDENDADTVRHFFAQAGRPLRQRGISYLRVDHTGKDASKGARGSSAKNDDVDIIWSMQQTRDGFQLKSKSRVSWVPQVANWNRVVTPDRIFYCRSAEIDEMVMDEQTTAKVYELEELGIDPTWGRDAVVKAMTAAGHSPGRLTVLSAAIKYRRERKLANPNATFSRPTEE